jgi:hypothetical protein
MTRAVFLSSGGDPFISLLVIKLWQEHWRDEIDTFYVCYNNHAGVPLDVVKEFNARIIDDPKIQLIYHPRGIGNGMPITEMTQIAREDLVMLLEDDGFIFSSGIFNECFQRIEKDQCDAVGSPRGSCGIEIWNAAQKKYNLDYSGYGDVGPNYWPNFFFCKRSDLLRTDLNFASKTWQAGEYSKELDHTFTEINHGDTFVWACVQLRYLGIRFFNVPQYHANPFDIDHADNYTNLFDNKARWVHGGSLSAGWGGYLSGQVPDVSADSSKQEIESRVAFWTIAASVIEGFGIFKSHYIEGIKDLIKNAQLDQERVNKKIQLYKQLMKL